MALHLTVSLANGGYHPASWRVSRLPPGPNAAALRAMAQTAERGKLDAVLLGVNPPATAAASMLPLDPLPLLGSLIGVTRQIGLGAAWTIDFTEPYHVARVFATLDHLSYGRTAWLATMFQTDALLPLIGRPNPAEDAAAYCERAGEFIDTVKQLWDSWEDEAFAVDKASGMFADPSLVHPIDHVGKFFSVRGPLNVPRPPQGNPVLIEADPGTPAGRELTAETAEIVLIACESLAEARAHTRELLALAARHQRPAGSMRTLVNLMLVLGKTEAEAKRRAAELDAGLPAAQAGLRFVGTPTQLVEAFADWQQQAACDGFNLLPAVLPDDLDLLVEDVIPLAQSRGLFRDDYAGTTLREHFGLARPRSQYAIRSSEPAGS